MSEMDKVTPFVLARIKSAKAFLSWLQGNGVSLCRPDVDGCYLPIPAEEVKGIEFWFMGVDPDALDREFLP
jgi:type II secretory pathway component PulL